MCATVTSDERHSKCRAANPSDGLAELPSRATLDLEQGVFKLRSPKRIAASLKRSAERSKRRKSDPYRSAMSMLTFYINRAGKSLPPARKKVLQRAKGELRKQFGKAS